MAEYVMKEGDTHQDVARRLLAEVDDPQAVAWSPRPDVYMGGVYVVNDDAAVAKVASDLKQARDAEAKRIADAQAFAEERDKQADETGMTPRELGFPAAVQSDPGAPGTEGVLADEVSAARGDGLLAPEIAQTDDETGADAGDEPVQDDPATPEDESQMTPAQRRKAARQRKADADAADANKSDASEEAK
jgi:hypothetical protein